MVLECCRYSSRISKTTLCVKQSMTNDNFEKDFNESLEGLDVIQSCSEVGQVAIPNYQDLAALNKPLQHEKLQKIQDSMICMSSLATG